MKASDDTSSTASDSLFREAFEACGAGMVIVAPGGRILRMNGSLCRLLGHAEGSAVGRNYRELIHPDQLEQTEHSVRRLYAGEIRSHQMEQQYLHADGRTVWGLVTMSLVHDAAGQPLHAVSQVQDITEQKRSDAILRQGELRYRRVVETSYEGVWTIDRDARTDYVNGRMAEMLGYAADEMVGRSMFDFMDDDARLEAAKNFERRQQGVVEVHEFRLQRKDGTPLWTQMSVNPILDVEGGFAGAMAMVTDITERRQVEVALRESEARYRDLVEQAPDGIVVHCNGRIVFANATAARLFRAGSSDSLIGTMLLDLLHPDYRERIRERVERVDAIGTVLPLIEETVIRLDGTVFDVELSGTVIAWQGRRAKQVVIRDITERRRTEATVRSLEEQFRHSQKMEAVGQLAGGIAHDFNNLLTVINNYSGFLLEELDETNPLRGDAVAIQRAGGRAASLTRQLLAFSRKQILRPETLDLKTVVAGLEPMLRRLIGEHIRIVVRNGPRLAAVKADPGQLEQVLVNLAVNARDAMPDGGTLLIETANAELDETYAARHPAVVPGAYVMLVVSDTGSGMDESTRSRVFEPFFTTKEVGRGTGLGLSTVYGIVKQSNGYIWCYSEPLLGTAFKMYLPRADGSGAEASDPGRMPATPTGAEVILLVEDEEQVRALARRILERHGYTIIEARDGGDALRIATRYSGEIDALVTDVVMPELAGHQVFQTLRSSRPSLRVLYMSGYTAYDNQRRGLVGTDVAFLQKPFTAASLARAVRAVLDGRQVATEQLA